MIQPAMQLKFLMKNMKKVCIDDVVSQLEHLNDQKKAAIKQVLS